MNKAAIVGILTQLFPHREVSQDLLTKSGVNQEGLPYFGFPLTSSQYWDKVVQKIADTSLKDLDNLLNTAYTLTGSNPELNRVIEEFYAFVYQPGRLANRNLNWLTVPNREGVWLLLTLRGGIVYDTRPVLVLGAKDDFRVTIHERPDGPKGFRKHEALASYNKPEYRWLLLTEDTGGQMEG